MASAGLRHHPGRALSIPVPEDRAGAHSADDLRGALARGAAALRVVLADAQLEAIDAYLALLAKWNDRYNLTAIRERSRMVTHHALDALAVVPHLPDRAGLRVLDVGSGAGIPGIFLAIARPHWHVTMLDANQKKTAFVTQAIAELGLHDAKAVQARVEGFVAPRFDVVISRAFASLVDFVEGAAMHVAPEGVLVAMKGAVPDDEIAALPPTVRVESVTPLVVPGLDAARSLVVIRPRSES
jgi:16S rRNA (guanine527-N7)-methyltransferase